MALKEGSSAMGSYWALSLGSQEA